MSTLRTLLLLLPALLSSGCLYRAHKPLSKDYYINPAKDLSNIGRVAIIELDNNSSYPQISLDITEALFQALQKKQVFGLTVISQKNPAWRSLQLDLDSKYTFKQLVAIRKTLKCDAVLIGTVTGYQPYPHMAIGLRLKLIDLMDGSLIWAIEEFWDVNEKTTQKRIEKYSKSQIREDGENLWRELVAVSSIKFIRFVAYETAKTIQTNRGG